jgi:organic hydroperoxide reductase OsmC/OhrA
MTMMKEIQFPCSVLWRGGRLVRASARGKESIELAAPPEFRSGLAGYWTPEELLVSASASSFVLTLAAAAERRGVPLIDATATATGHMSRRDDGRFGFTVIEIDAELETLAGSEEAVSSVARAAAKRCLIAQALDVPTHVSVSVKAVRPAADVTKQQVRT